MAKKATVKWRTRREKVTQHPAVRRLADEARENAHKFWAALGAGALGYVNTGMPDWWEKMTVAGVTPPWTAAFILEVAGRGLKSRKMREAATGALCVASFETGQSLGNR